MKRKYLVGYLVGNDVDTLHEEKIHLLVFSFIRVIDLITHYIYNFCTARDGESWILHIIFILVGGSQIY